MRAFVLAKMMGSQYNLNTLRKLKERHTIKLGKVLTMPLCLTLTAGILSGCGQPESDVQSRGQTGLKVPETGYAGKLPAFV